MDWLMRVEQIGNMFFGTNLDKEIADYRTDAKSYDYVPSDRVADALEKLKKSVGKYCSGSIYNAFVNGLNTTGTAKEFDASLELALGTANGKPSRR